MNLPLVHADWAYALWASLMFLAALGFWADNTRVGKNISGLAIVLAVSMALSNLGVLPKVADAYNVVWLYLVPVAVPLLLLKADLRRVLVETRSMLAAFVLGAIGTTVGAIIGFYLIPLGEQGNKLVGVFSATYIGGSMNMAAVGQALELDASLMTASVAADNVIGVLYLVFLALVPTLAIFRRYYGEDESVSLKAVEVAKSALPETGLTPIDLTHIGFALGLSFLISALGVGLANLFELSSYGILFITAITLVLANLFPRHLARLKGDYEIGIFMMYVFFAAIGISADIGAMLSSALVLAVYVVLIVVCHALFVFIGSRWFNLKLMEVVIASNACASGPASAAALAAGKGRTDLVAPAVLLGVLGYAVANFVGIGLATWLAG